MYDLPRMPQIERRNPAKDYIEMIFGKAKTLKYYTKEDQEVSIECRTVSGPMRVACLELSDCDFVIVHGYDEFDNQTFHCAPYSLLEITMKIVNSVPERAKAKIGFVVEGRELAV
jgi:hypothetical protein